MKVPNQKFETMLTTKGMSKKAFSAYAQIPYFTVAGWKKSGNVPAYAMILLENIPAPKYISAEALINAGMPRALFWNNDLTKEVPSDIFIVSTLQRAYNEMIIQHFIAYFGEDVVLSAIIKHKDKLSDKLIDHVTDHIHHTLASA